jgi:cysteinyl-tRNA synthetase
MNMKAFGEQIDIHGGGRDLIFPHHENEIAQTEALTGKTFAKYWIHNGLIKVNGQKMSKSLGNSLVLHDLLEAYHPETIKFALLQKYTIRFFSAQLRSVPAVQSNHGLWLPFHVLH